MGSILLACGFVAGKAFQIASLLLGGAPDLTVPLAGEKRSSLELKSFDLFFWSDVEVMFECFLVLHPLIDNAGYFDHPLPGFSFYLILIASIHCLRCLYVAAEVFHLTLVAGDGCQRPGFKEPDGPQVFIYPNFLHIAGMVVN